MRTRVLISGGAGFVGSSLVERLVAENYKVIIVDDLSNGRIENLRNVFDKITFIGRDVSTPFYKEFPKTVKADIIYHLSCFPRSMSFDNPVRDVEVNVIGMVNILELARMNDSRVIFSSNSGIYNTTEIPINEETPDHPTAPYDLDKLMAEEYMCLYSEAYGIEGVTFRFATVFGPRQRTSPDWKPVVIEFIDKLSKGIAPTIYWSGDQSRDFIYVEDVVDGLMAALDTEKGLGETMILGSGVETSIMELYELVSEVLGVDIEPLRGPKALGDIARMRYDCAKAERLLGWTAGTSLAEGIRKTVDWYSKNG